MLSKLAFFEAGDAIKDTIAERQALREAIEQYLLSRAWSARVEPFSGGTLGVCFRLEANGTKRFLKTHEPGAQARTNLAKEADILLRLYGAAVVVECFEVRPKVGATRLCVVMDELAHLTEPMTADDAAAMVRGYTGRFEGYRPAGLPVDWDFEHYLDRGDQAVGIMSDRSLVGGEMADEVRRQLALLRRQLGAMPRAICHGDLGPKNVMTDGERPIVIDWEDAFWGVEGYDFLYWLTFMANRHFLHTAAFGRTPLGPATERAILVLVVLLKSLLSVWSGTLSRNNVAIEARLAEVLALTQVD